MRSLWLLSALLIVSAAAYAAPDPESQAKGALSLAKAKREREAQVKAAALPCHKDYDEAAAEAQKGHKPLVLWVGMTCADVPELRKGLSDAVHCHVDVFAKDRTPRVVVQGGDGIDYYVVREKIDRDTAAKIKAKWEAKPQPPLLRPDARITEEAKAHCPQCAGNCQCGSNCRCGATETE